MAVQALAVVVVVVVVYFFDGSLHKALKVVLDIRQMCNVDERTPFLLFTK